MNRLILVLILISLSFCNNRLIAQNTNNSITSILQQMPYDMDSPEYGKAKLIIEKLIGEIGLNNMEILEILDSMVIDPTNIEKQILIRFYNMPVFTDTGNPDIDNLNYINKKNEWIENNPDKYQKYNNSFKTQIK